ncbi:MAG: hypothetical protein K2P20_00485 [Oscillospiraceae bacterium]|nr:hypothetical protein [Oscillospiraceae bacterium]
MHLEQTQDELLAQLWAGHQDLGDTLTILASLLSCGELRGPEDSCRRCFALLRDRVCQYTGEIQRISDILTQKSV